ncbi:MAG: hypothetical protein KF678_06930 [Phycisphaeraceae bacterium]|nr:hypothetical protein [Phycisphaeraceae bacterium]
MDDRRLEALVRMAVEAEALEREAAPLRLVGAPVRRRPWLIPLATAMAAAAAAVTLVTLVLPSMNPAPPVRLTDGSSPTHVETPRELTGDTMPGFDKPLAARTVSNRDDDEASVVLAFFEGLDGRCTCMHIQDEEWDIAELAEKHRGELLDVAYRSKCGTATPNLLVVAIAGKRDALPRSPEQAEALAAELARFGRTPEQAYQAVSNLPAGSMVVTERVGTRNAIMDLAKFSLR